MRPASVIHTLLWGGAVGSALAAAYLHDGRIALQQERVWWVLGLGTAHILGWAALAWPIARWTSGWRTPLVAGLIPLTLTLGLWLPGLGSAPAPAPAVVEPTEPLPDILLITLDTFRADHLADPDARVDTAHLDAFAREAAWFTRAISPSPLTAPAHASMLTGMRPQDHGLLANGYGVEVGTVVERIRQRGYHTGAFLGSRVLDASTGLDQGFHHYEDRWTRRQRLSWLLGQRGTLHQGENQRRGDRVAARARAWWQEVDGPTFTWVHLYDPHAPYQPPVRFEPTWQELQAAQAADATRPREAGTLGSVLRGLVAQRPHERRLFYEAEVEWTDHLIAALLEPRTPGDVVIIVGDHGESLGENDYWFNHGARLWEPSLHVPLLVRWPGQLEGGQTVDTPVSTSGVAELLLAAAGVPVERNPLLETARGAPAEPIFSFTTGQEAHPTLGYRGDEDRRWHRGPVAAARLDHHKVLAFSGSPARYHDLEADPGEADPRDIPEALQDLARQVEALSHTRAPGLSAEQQALLLELGYVE